MSLGLKRHGLYSSELPKRFISCQFNFAGDPNADRVLNRIR